MIVLKIFIFGKTVNDMLDKWMKVDVDDENKRDHDFNTFILCSMLVKIRLFMYHVSCPFIHSQPKIDLSQILIISLFANHYYYLNAIPVIILLRNPTVAIVKLLAKCQNAEGFLSFEKTQSILWAIFRRVFLPDNLKYLFYCGPCACVCHLAMLCGTRFANYI